MPRQVDIDRGNAIRDYFREHYAGKIQDVGDCWEDLRDRFGLSRSRWYYWRDELSNINELYLRQQGKMSEPQSLVQTPPQEDQPTNVLLTLPADLSEAAKGFVNKLLAIHEEKLQELDQAHTAAKVQGELRLADRRKVDFLKRLTKELIDQL